MTIVDATGGSGRSELIVCNDRHPWDRPKTVEGLNLRDFHPAAIEYATILFADRLIVAGDIVDYIGIRFPIGDIPGAIDFIDIKTGKSASLSSDQRKLRDLIEKSADIFSFKVVKVQIT